VARSAATDPAGAGDPLGRQCGQRAAGWGEPSSRAKSTARAAGQHAQRQAARGVPATASAGTNAQLKATRKHWYASGDLVVRGGPNMRVSSAAVEVSRATTEFYFSTGGETNDFLGNRLPARPLGRRFLGSNRRLSARKPPVPESTLTSLSRAATIAPPARSVRAAHFTEPLREKDSFGNDTRSMQRQRPADSAVRWGSVQRREARECPGFGARDFLRLVFA
jgi:hypothetical protein